MSQFIEGEDRSQATFVELRRILSRVHRTFASSIDPDGSPY